jgi:MinD-like ATPase involved in chromosome partitioning or flagellar assembly
MTTIGFIAIKGGVGKTTATSNLASALANQFKKKVLVVDGNFSAPNIGIHFGILEPKITIHHAITRKADIKDAIIDSRYGFDIIPGQLNFKGQLEYLRLKDKLNKIKSNYDYILIDSSPNLNNEMLATILASDMLFVVTTPDYPTLSCTMQAVKIAKEKKTPIVGLILNRVYDKNFELNVNDIEETAEVPVVAVIPHNTAVLEALSKTMPAHSFKPRQEGSIEYNKLAAAICNENYKDPRFLARLKQYLMRDLSKQEVNRAVFNKKD